MKTLRSSWALPAFLRLSLAFSVHDDLLAHPQYQVQFLDSYVHESFASSRLTLGIPSQASSAGSPPNSQETQELSHETKGEHSDDHESNGPATFEVMTLGLQRYLCRIPIVDPPRTNTTNTNTRDEEEKELMRATDRGWELLQGMQGDCIYYLSGWWSYSFCYNDEVKQFHQLPPGKGVPMYPPVEDTQVQSFVLGRFPKNAQSGDGVYKQDARFSDDDDTVLFGGQNKGTMELAKLETKGETRYMVQKLAGGTVCDLTGRERKIEVQFHCNPSAGDRIGMIKEVSTCSYLMVIYTPRLCNDVAFLPPQEDKPNAITCHAIFPDNTDLSLINQKPLARLNDDAEVPAKAEEDDDSENEATTEGSLTSNDNPALALPTVGGVVVGAKISVGTPGKVIEKSVVVGGGKEIVLGTVATSDGKTMNERELRKLNIKNPADIEKLKKNLDKLAGGKGWRLDLVDTPRGREFRGIIEGDEEETDGDQKGQKTPPAAKGEKSGRQQRQQQQDGEEEEDGSEEVYKEEL